MNVFHIIVVSYYVISLTIICENDINSSQIQTLHQMIPTRSEDEQWIQWLNRFDSFNDKVWQIVNQTNNTDLEAIAIKFRMNLMTTRDELIESLKDDKLFFKPTKRNIFGENIRLYDFYSHLKSTDLYDRVYATDERVTITWYR